jgi:hypothetical protein
MITSSTASQTSLTSAKTKKKQSFLKKLHKWPGLVIAFILIYYGITGIILNHRKFFSEMSISRNLLPENYEYTNWNNAALKGNLIINADSILVYGNIGIWLTDSTFTNYKSFNHGLPKGIDNRKTFDLIRAGNNELFAATFSGAYAYDRIDSLWKRFDLPGKDQRFTGIECIGDTLYLINRSFLFKGKAAGVQTSFRRFELPAPEGYSGKVTLFSVIWQIHSGEILGLPGKLFIDLMGIITIFLSATGIIYFFFPGWIKRGKTRNKTIEKIAGINRWSLRWHNKTGAWTIVFLTVLFFTGIFLRPPFLIAIANSKIKPPKFTHTDKPNPWNDKLRDILYDTERKVLLLSTSEGMYHTGLNTLKPVRFNNQPPVSIMGINSFQSHKNGAFMIGSFSGLFLWHPDLPGVLNYMTGDIYREPASGRPVGDYKITGTISTSNGGIFVIDYDKGIIPGAKQKVFPVMPPQITKESGMSLWNLCLEIHTGRFFQNLLGPFYILIVPLGGLTAIMVVLSGYFYWRKKFRLKK